MIAKCLRLSMKGPSDASGDVSRLSRRTRRMEERGVT